MTKLRDTQTLVLITGLLTTIAVWPQFMEPFNFPKLCALVVLTAACVSKNFIIMKNNGLKFTFLKDKVVLFAVLFIFFFWIRTLFNDDVYTGIFGSYGRYTGALTYSCWILIFLQSVLFKIKFDLQLVMKFFYLTAAIVYSYALLQMLDLDVLGWNSQYDGIFSTLGNPNFLSAYSAAVIVASFWQLFSVKPSLAYFVPVTYLLISIPILVNADSLQGYVLSAYGVFLIVVLKLYELKKSAWKGLLFLGVTLTPLSLLGIVGIGPLGTILFQESNIYRLDFWKTGINMIKSEPLLGIGIERYGSEFRSYRELEQVFRTDPNQTSDSAHNVIIHIASTGGLPLAILFSFILVISFWRALLRLKNRGDSANTAFFLVMSSTIFIQNLLSVDNLAMSTWQWIFLAALNGENPDSREVDSVNKSRSTTQNYSTLEAKLVLSRFIFVLFAILILFRPIASQISLKNSFYLQLNVRDSAAVAEKLERLRTALAIDSRNVYLARLGANSLYIDQAWDAASNMAAEGVKIDPEDYVSWWFLASALEESGKTQNSLAPRLKTIELDPHNYFNYFLICKSYYKLGDQLNLERYARELYRIAPNSREAQEIRKLVM